MKKASVHWPSEMGTLDFWPWCKMITPVEMVTERVHPLESSKAFKSINALHQIFCLNLMDTEAPKGMPSMSSECVDDLADLPKNTWSKMDLMPDVLDPGWSDGSNGGCSCADGGFWDVCFKMAAANFSCLLQGKHQPAEYRHTSQGCELQPDWLHCRWR